MATMTLVPLSNSSPISVPGTFPLKWLLQQGKSRFPATWFGRLNWRAAQQQSGVGCATGM
jgi:hypothetical protein